MNKPAPKEPSMDEILSSIRQIIADDDAAAAPPKPAPAPMQAAQPQMPAPLRPVSPEPNPAPMSATPLIEPIALSMAQIIPDMDTVPDVGAAFDATGTGPEDNAMLADMPELVDPEDIAFEPDEVVAPPPAIDPPAPRPSVARATPMPDPTLSSDMAEQLLEPATNAAVRQTFSKLSGMATVSNGQTIEAMMREMLRPMLKQWLDENLPSVVERMVEKEIARVSRGE